MSVFGWRLRALLKFSENCPITRAHALQLHSIR
jgi:hypothetical protein